MIGVLDEDGQLRQCVSRLGRALSGLLGEDPGPRLATRYRELAGLSREVACLCDQRATQIDWVEPDPHSGPVTR